MITTLQYNLFRLLYTCRTNAKELHTLKASADEMKVYIDQIVSKAEAQGLQHYTTDGNVQRFYSCVFKLWDKIKILIVAFLQTYFILNILLPCSSVSSFICPSESCAALVVHDLTSPCFELVLTVLIRWMLHFQCVKTTVRSFWLAMRTDAFSVLKALLRSYTLEILHM